MEKLKSHFLSSVYCQGSGHIPQTSMAKDWYLQGTKFKSGLSKIRFHVLMKTSQLIFFSFTLLSVYERFAPRVQVQHASVWLGMLTQLPAGFDYTSTPFPTSQLKRTTQGRPACTVRESQSKYHRQLPLPFTLQEAW